jgi:hypothetical protein
VSRRPRHRSIADPHTPGGKARGKRSLGALPPAQPAPQAEIRLAPTAVQAGPLAAHRLQFILGGKDENLDVGEDVPAVTAAGVGNATSRRWRQINRA